MIHMENIVRWIVGKRLTAMLGTFHLYNGCDSADPIAVWLTFDGRSFRFAGSPNGWHLIIDDIAPNELDLGESGTIRIRDLSAKPAYIAVMGQHVSDGWLIESTLPNGIIGVRFDFGTSTIRILNWGDEMYLAQDFPSDADSMEINEHLIIR